MAENSCKIMLGPARTGKRLRLAEQYTKTLKCAEESAQLVKSLWLLPSNSAVSETRDLIASLVTSAVLEPGIYTFAGFAEAVISESARPIRPITPLQQRHLLGQAIERARSENRLDYFLPVASTPGFFTQLTSWIAEQKRQDAWAEDLQKQASSKRERELALLYGEYQRLLAVGKLYDAEGRFWAARDILSAATGGKFSKIDQLVVTGFTDFTVAQLYILRTLAKVASQTRIALTADANLLETEGHFGRGMMFSPVCKTLRHLQEALPKAVLDYETGKLSLPKSLRVAEQRLFGEHSDDAADDSADPRTLRAIAAAGEQQELVLVAAQIKRQLLSGEIRPEQVAVVSRNLRADSARIAEVLQDHGIPYWMETQSRLAGSTLLRSLHQLLRLHVENWPFRLLLELAGNRTITAFDSPKDIRPRVALEQSIRTAQIPSGRKRLIEQLERWASASTKDREEPAKQAFVADQLLTLLSDRLDDLPAAAEFAEWPTHLESLLTALGVLKSGSLAEWRLISQALHAVGQAESWALGESQQADVRELLSALQTIGDQLAMPSTNDDVGRVRVLTAESARHLTIPHIHLVGLTEQSFSASVTSPQLDASPQRSAGQLAADQAEMMYLFYTMVTRATESLTISYPALDDKGQPLPPSPMLEELQRCFRPDSISTTIQQPGTAFELDSSPTSRTAHRHWAVLQAQQGQPALLAGLLGSLAVCGRATIGGIGAVASRAKREAFGPFEGLLESDVARKALTNAFDVSHLWSPSQLEDYAGCPFRFFAGQLLGLKPAKDITVANDMGRRGSMLHQVLASVHQRLAEQPLELSDDEPLRELLAERFREELANEIAAHPLSGLQESLREIERREVDSWATQYAEQELTYRSRWEEIDQPPRPAHFEVRFGPEVSGGDQAPQSPLSKPVPFELDLGEAQIRITGQIDRIDLGRVGEVTVFNIIDYKSGKEVRFKHEHLASGKQLQLPLYAMAAEQLLLADQGAQAMAVGYWSIQGKGFEKGALHLKTPAADGLQSSSEWEEIQAQLVETLKQLVNGVQQGEFPVYNSDENCTSWCDYRTICRVAQIRSLEKRWPEEGEPQE